MARKEKDIVWYGMKVSPEEKEMIKKLADHYNTSQKEVVMGLVKDRVADLNSYVAGKSNPDILKYAGVFEGSPNLSSDKSHLEEYGLSSLS